MSGYAKWSWESREGDNVFIMVSGQLGKGGVCCENFLFFLNTSKSFPNTFVKMDVKDVYFLFYSGFH